MKKIAYVLVTVALFFTTTACGKTTKSRSKGERGEFKQLITEHPSWLAAAKKTEAKWGVPVHVQFAIMHTESHFKPTAKNPKSSAFGFAQAIDATWRSYVKATGNNAPRSNFAAASDFIGWYADQANDSIGISKNNAYQIYIAYHDGIGKYKSTIKRPNSTVPKLARGVQKSAVVYKNVLSTEL